MIITIFLYNFEQIFKWLNFRGNFIKSKIIIVALIFAVLICLPCASAVDANQTDFEAQSCDVIEEEILTDESTDTGNFTALGELISQSDNELTLEKNYKFNSSTDKDFDGFRISKDNYVVDGKGHTIDGSGEVKIFVFTGSNITPTL